MKTLRVSPALELPLQLVTHRNALLAMSGAGKSNACVVIAEEMHRAGVPWCALDPKGDWWGIRSSSDGKGAGLDVPILGGDHADLPLSPNAGARMAELVATGKLTGVFDLSDFAHERQTLARFMAEFGAALLQHQRTPIHLFLDEADEYLPQGDRLDGHVAACVAAWKRVATKGRQKGIGYTLISQRSANVNKSALYMCETLIAMRTMGKRDRDAIRDFVEAHGKAEELMKSLSSLEDGEAWIWSPVRLRMMQRARFRRRETFDSGRTPELGEALVVPRLADIDLGALRAELEQLDQAAEPKPDSRPNGYPQQMAELRGRIAELEREVQAAREGCLPAATVEALTKAAAGLIDQGNAIKEAGHEVIGALGRLGVLARPTPAVVHRDAKPEKTNGHHVGDLPSKTSPSAPAPRVAEKRIDGLSKGEAAVLTAIAQHRDGVTREQLTVLTGYKRSSRDTFVQKIRAAGLAVERGGLLVATDSGRKRLGTGFRPLPTGKALREYWLERLGGGERAVLEVLISAYPKAVSREELDQKTGYRRSSRDTFLQKLRVRRLAIEAPGGTMASEELF